MSNVEDKTKQSDEQKKAKAYATMANDLARKAVFHLTRSQFNILFFLMSKIKRDDEIDHWYKVPIQELCEALYWNIDNGGYYYQRIKADLEYLRTAKWVKTTSGEALTSWVQNADYDDNIRVDDNGKMIQAPVLILDEREEDGDEEKNIKKHKWSGTIHYRFDAYISQFLFHLTGNYTLIELSQLISFIKPHSIRLYLFLKSYVYKEKLDKNEPIFVKRNLNELKRIMWCKSDSKIKNPNPDSLLKYFIRDTIKPAVEEINAKSSEFHVEFILEKDEYTKNIKNIQFVLTKAGYTQQENAKRNLESLKKRMKDR